MIVIKLIIVAKVAELHAEGWAADRVAEQDTEIG